MSTFSNSSEKLSRLGGKKNFHSVSSFLSIAIDPLKSAIANLGMLLLVLVERSRYLLWHLYVIQISEAERLGWNTLENGKSRCRNPLAALVEINLHAFIVALIWGWI
ncbi:hypothetical protein [Ruegeria arenilitoris]|uniref:hypothetical protein n=1 Tax=Ruegeria arenilitoris TaxID=1173585 RepID=UPI001480F797|nr:hypothetical protein [Ruegeria arenilitoris]